MSSTAMPWPVATSARPPLPEDPLAAPPAEWETKLHALADAPWPPEDDHREHVRDALTELDLLRQISVGDTLLRQRQWSRAKTTVEAWRATPERIRGVLPEALRRALDELSLAVR